MGLNIFAGIGGKRWREFIKKRMMIKQNDPRMPELVRKWGCFWRSLGAMVEIDTGRPFSADELVAAYEHMQTIEAQRWQPRYDPSAPIMDECCWLYRPGMVLREFYKMRKQDRRFQAEWSENVPESLPYVIQLETTSDVGTHFRLIDWDPYDPTIAGRVVGYRAFREL